jgi:hypothetical protein
MPVAMGGDKTVHTHDINLDDHYVYGRGYGAR